MSELSENDRAVVDAALAANRAPVEIESNGVGYIVTLPVAQLKSLVETIKDGELQVLVRAYKNGTISADLRANYGTWEPVEFFEGRVERVEI